MINDLSRTAEEFLRSGAFDAKKDSIKNAANTSYGKNVKQLLEKSGFEEAVKSGDINALKENITNILKTEDGSRLMRELSKIMDK